MNVYVYQAALLCEDCGRKACDNLKAEGKAPDDPSDESSYDSDDYPKGPYGSASNEADCPHHCDHCGVFLENPLTDEGRRWLVKHALECDAVGDGLKEWLAFYEVDLSNDLDEFARGYITCALWTSTDESRDDGGDPLDANYDASDVETESLLTMVKDCRTFKKTNQALLKDSNLSDEQAGHDFWLTRNGHGVGFWDRGLGEVGDKLSDACKPFGTCYIYVDGGKVYCE